MNPVTVTTTAVAAIPADRWNYVWAAYGVVAATLAVYGGVLLWRAARIARARQEVDL